MLVGVRYYLWWSLRSQRSISFATTTPQYSTSESVRIDFDNVNKENTVTLFSFLFSAGRGLIFGLRWNYDILWRIEWIGKTSTLSTYTSPLVHISETPLGFVMLGVCWWKTKDSLRFAFAFVCLVDCLVSGSIGRLGPLSVLAQCLSATFTI